MRRDTLAILALGNTSKLVDLFKTNTRSKVGSKHGSVKNTQSFTLPPNSHNSTKSTAAPLAEKGSPDIPFYWCICDLSFCYFSCKLLLPVKLSKASTLSLLIPFLKTPLCHISCKESSIAPR